MTGGYLWFSSTSPYYLWQNRGLEGVCDIVEVTQVWQTGLELDFRCFDSCGWTVLLPGVGVGGHLQIAMTEVHESCAFWALRGKGLEALALGLDSWLCQCVVSSATDLLQFSQLPCEAGNSALILKTEQL